MHDKSLRRSLLVGLFASAVALVPAAALASDAWVLGFRTTYIRYPGEADCEALSWQDKLYFFNANSAAATVRLIGISNGGTNRTGLGLTIASKTSFSVSASSSALPWDPCLGGCPVTLFVAHLDVPAGVSISSRAEVISTLLPMPDTVCPLPGFKARVFAGLSLPVKKELTPAGVPQYHLGIDAGTDTDGESGPAADARTNIGIYNQAGVTANATIETRRVCDDLVIEQRTVSVPANSVIQFGGLSSDTASCVETIKSPRYAAYAVVTVDQPSFSYAMTLRNDMVPEFAGTSAVTQ